MDEKIEHRTPAPTEAHTSPCDAHTPAETLRLTEQAGVNKAHLSWLDLIVRSFLAGVFISLGAAFDLVVTGGAVGLRATDPGLATLAGAFVFPVGFVIIINLQLELCTSNMFVMAYSTLRRRTTLYDLARNLVVSYIGNIAGCLFYAGVLCYCSDTLGSDAQKAYASSQAEGRVVVNWGSNVARGIMCNWLVALAFYLATQGRDLVSKVYGIWIPIWCFAAMGYQHSIANYLLVPIGMFYGGTSFGVGRFVWACCIPVTLGNLLGGAFFGAFALWMVCGRHEPSVPRLKREKKQVNGSRV
ncbi:hypothetical protein PG988_013878 [Apiospora saccharicola]